MDDDTADLVFVGAVVAFLLFLPLIIILSTISCLAWSRTKQWKKEKANVNDPESNQSEAETLIANDTESELDPEDSEDEAEIKVREEQRRDLTLTTRQKFRKEFGKLWKGDKTIEEKQKAKEREERKKLAKAVAKELVRMERRKNRAANKLGREQMDAESLEGLPAYNQAVENARKH